jgi:hypothetical protein
MKGKYITILLHEMLSNNAKPVQDSCSDKNYTQEDTEWRMKPKLDPLLANP